MAGPHEKGKPEVYPDLRYQFLRGLIQYEEWQRTRHYLKSAAECTSRAIVSLALSPEPIQSPRQAQQLECIGGETLKRLKKFVEEDRLPSAPPLPGMFVSSAGALLVALKIEEDVIKDNRSEVKHVPEDLLKTRAAKICEEEFTSDGFCLAWWRMEVLIKRGYVKRRFHRKLPVYQLLPRGQDTADRLLGISRDVNRGDPQRRSGPLAPHTHPLRSGPLAPHTHPLKSVTLAPHTHPLETATLAPHTLPLPEKPTPISPEESKNLCGDNWTSNEIMATTGPSGDRVKQNVTCIESSGIGEGSRGTEGGRSSDREPYGSPTASLQSGHSQKEARSSLLPWQCAQTTNGCWQGTDQGSDGLVMIIDSSEWNMNQERLRQVGQTMKHAGILVSYRTDPLTSGAYSWRWRCHGDERVLPSLVERKQADDVQSLLKEGKFWSQVQKMVDWKKSFINLEIPCEVYYIIEEEADKGFTVHCPAIGKSKTPTLTQVKNAVLDLTRHPDIQVLQSDSIEESLVILESIGTDLDQKIKKGKFDVLLEMEWENCRHNIIQGEEHEDDEDHSFSQGRVGSSEEDTKDTHLNLTNRNDRHHPQSPRGGGNQSDRCKGRRELNDVHLPESGEDLDDPDWLPDLVPGRCGRTSGTEVLVPTGGSTSDDNSRIPHKILKRRTEYNQDQVSVNGKKLLLSKAREPDKKNQHRESMQCEAPSSSCGKRKAGSLSGDMNPKSRWREEEEEEEEAKENSQEAGDWWKSRDKEPLVMYHNSYGFQPRLPSTDRWPGTSVSKVSSYSESQRRNLCSTEDRTPPPTSNREGYLGSTARAHPRDSVTHILDMFPALSRDRVCAVLRRHAGDINSCVEELLQTQEGPT